mmetsp:Transcript_40229/g.89306  ORF Transcript_40229/g.89306 Transcript_40229/m.89306 type:complete len:309 (+) Transcript_40229:100-1026(+)
MPVNKDDLLSKLKSAGVSYDVYEHPAAMTVEEQSEALSGHSGVVIKNLLLKDKRHRLYIISALASTNVDLKLLSARLGTGKGGITFAPEELVDAVLKVPLGSVTPLAVVNPEAKDVALLLDHKIRQESKVFVHPLVNTVSLALSPSALDAALRACGREPIYVDLEADPKIDKENPPDLAAYAPAVAAAAPFMEQLAEKQAAALAAPSTSSAPPAKAKGKDKKAAAPASPQQTSNATNVSARTEEVLQKVCQALLGCKFEEVKVSDPYVLARLRADVEMSLNAFKNAAYTTGYTAGKAEIVGYAERKYA